LRDRENPLWLFRFTSSRKRSRAPAARLLSDRRTGTLQSQAAQRLQRVRDRSEANAAGSSTRNDAKATAAVFSGHSMRAGYPTSAAAKKLPSYRISGAHPTHVGRHGQRLHPRSRPV